MPTSVAISHAKAAVVPASMKPAAVALGPFVYAATAKPADVALGPLCVCHRRCPKAVCCSETGCLAPYSPYNGWVSSKDGNLLTPSERDAYGLRPVAICKPLVFKVSDDIDMEIIHTSSVFEAHGLICKFQGFWPSLP
ncbi:hypothetical protein SUGI_0474870 [Cryptomeria japonica]|nr:hypothetical protein SUGI_0474870 [Cryptomeria japonica]